jgi:hypothetical protein
MRILQTSICLLALVAAGVAYGAPPPVVPPFTECPALGENTGCALLVVFNPDGSVSILVDPNQGPYDGDDDTLVGVYNNSGRTQTSLTLSGIGVTGAPIFSFEGDGLCTFAPFTGSNFCAGNYYQTDPGDYAGPANTFTNISDDQTTGTVVFTGGLANGATTYFSLEDELTSATLPVIHPAFFTGEVSLGSGVYYLQFQNGNLFGYYNYQAFPWLFHYDLGFEYFIDGGNGSAYMYDFASGHWWFTSPTLFPYLYDFTLKTFIYYFPNTNSPGHYTSTPRYFSNLTTSKIFTM